MIFEDRTEILLSSESKLVTFVNKNRERTTMSLSDALDSNNPELDNRLKYTRDILNYMVNRAE